MKKKITQKGAIKKENSQLEKTINKMDTEIMQWFYDCCKINFGVEMMMQDSSELRYILMENLKKIIK